MDYEQCGHWHDQDPRKILSKVLSRSVSHEYLIASDLCSIDSILAAILSVVDDDLVDDPGSAQVYSPPLIASVACMCTGAEMHLFITY